MPPKQPRPLQDPLLARLPILLIMAVTIATSGCRAIGRFGESRQTIAARRLSGQGFKAMHDGQWDVAETLFTDALDVSTTDDRAHWGLGESLWQRSERDAAIKHMEQAVRLSAGDPKLTQRLGRMYLEVGRLAEAEAQSLLALKAERNLPESWALRGDCLRAGGQPEEALAAYHRALALQPDFPEVQLRAAEIYGEQERYDRLLATLDRMQDGLNSSDAPARVDVLQGIAMRRLGRDEEARRCFLRAAGKDPSDATPHLQLASIWLDKGETDAARDALTVALRLNPDSVHEGTWLEQLERQQQQRLASDPALDADATPQRR